MSTQPVSIVTGASSGFGHALTLQLLEQGHRVYAAARSVDRMKDLKTAGAHILPMDVTSDEQVRRGVGQNLADCGHIDVLYLNAGYGAYGTIEEVGSEEVRHQFDVNIFGMDRLVKAVLPAMRERRSGRLVFSVSLASHLSMFGIGWYAASKHALFAMATALRQEVHQFGIDVVMIRPGIVRTGFEAAAFASLANADGFEDYRPSLEKFRTFMRGQYAGGAGPRSTVRALLKAGTVRRPRAIYTTTPEVPFFLVLLSFLGPRVIDRVIRLLMKI